MPALFQLCRKFQLAPSIVRKIAAAVYVQDIAQWECGWKHLEPVDCIHPARIG